MTIGSMLRRFLKWSDLRGVRRRRLRGLRAIRAAADCDRELALARKCYGESTHWLERFNWSRLIVDLEIQRDKLLAIGCEAAERGAS